MRINFSRSEFARSEHLKVIAVTSVLLMLGLSVGVYAQSRVATASKPTPPPIIVGKWHITSSSPPSAADDIYYIYPGGRALDYHVGGWDTGQWAPDGASGYDFIWQWNFGPPSGPFMDSVHVEPDGNHITYHNQYGYQMTGIRLDNGQPTAVIQTFAEQNECKVGRLITLDGGSSIDDGNPNMLTYQ